MATAEQKVRLQLTGSMEGNVTFQHEGPDVVRWMTGGNAPSIYGKFRHRGSEIAVLCPECEEELGRFDASYASGTYSQIQDIRIVGASHQHRSKGER